MADPQREYELRYKTSFVESLGDGKDGFIRKTAGGHAVKFLHDPDSYARELRAYGILQHLNLDELAGHQVPRLIRNDDNLLAIEMTIVSPPFLLDFAAAYTNEEVERLGFSSEVLEER